jgi:alkanesulfonate monooxygenase SsuD/methylene tetrahydromethanopterin reductase-like flavin-dependent oxidoreductase (luciferase family)
MQLGTSLRFVFPTGPEVVELFHQMARNLPPGGFMDNPSGSFDTGEQARNLVEVAQAVAAADLDLLLLGERHNVPTNVFQPIPTLGRLLAHTGQVPVGGLFLAPFHQPIRLAEDLAALAAFAPAPLTVAFAVGDVEAQFAAYGLDIRTRARRTEEVVEIVRRLLTGERVTFHGRHHELHDVVVRPTPDIAPRIWIAGRRGPAVERAGRLGDGWIADATAGDEALATELARYRQTAEEAGRRPCPVLRRDIHVGDSDADAWKVVEPVLEAGYRGITDADRLLVGSPDTIVDRLLADAAKGWEVCLVRHIVGDHHLMLESFTRLGEGVMPSLRRG